MTKSTRQKNLIIDPKVTNSINDPNSITNIVLEPIYNTITDQLTEKLKWAKNPEGLSRFASKAIINASNAILNVITKNAEETLEKRLELLHAELIKQKSFLNNQRRYKFIFANPLPAVNEGLNKIVKPFLNVDGKKIPHTNMVYKALDQIKRQAETRVKLNKYASFFDKEYQTLEKKIKKTKSKELDRISIEVRKTTANEFKKIVDKYKEGKNNPHDIADLHKELKQKRVELAQLDLAKQVDGRQLNSNGQTKMYLDLHSFIDKMITELEKIAKKMDMKLDQPINTIKLK